MYNKITVYYVNGGSEVFTNVKDAFTEKLKDCLIITF